MTDTPANSTPRPWRASRIVFTMLCLAWGAAGAYHTFVPATYESRVLFKVPDAKSAQELALSPELRSIASRILAERAGDIPEGGPVDKLDDTLSGTLYVHPDTAQQTLELSYHTRSRDHAVEELTAVVDAYLLRDQENLSTEKLAKLKELEREEATLNSVRDEQFDAVSQANAKLAERILDETSRVATLERVKTLSQRLTEARLERLTAEMQLREVNRSLEQRTPLDLIVASLEDGKAKETVKVMMDRSRAAEELMRQRKTLDRLAGVYGSRHPQLIKVKEHVADLKNRVAGFDEESAIEPTSSDFAGSLLKSLDDDLERRRSAEQELAEHVELEQAELNEQKALERERDEARDKLDAAEVELEDLAARIATARRPLATAVRVVQQPWLNPEAVSPSLGLLFLIATGCGSLLGVAVSSIFGNSSRSNLGRRQRKITRGTAYAAMAVPQMSLKQRRELRMMQLQQTRE